MSDLREVGSFEREEGGGGNPHEYVLSCVDVCKQ